MGWDAFAVRADGADIKRLWAWQDGRDGVADAVLDEAFAAAVERARADPGVDTTDFLLRHAGLDVSACAEALEEATGEDAWSEDGWTAEMVKELAGRADWNACTQEAWAVASAREFLNTCAAQGLGVRFSW